MSIATDFRFALRRIGRHPGYAMGLIATLALGIAVSAAMYSVVHGVVVKGLDYPHPDRLLVLKSANSQIGGDAMALSGAEAESLIEIEQGIDSAGYYFWGGATYLGGETPRMVSGIHVGGDFFQTLGVSPQLGRWLVAEDGGADARIVLGHGLWQELFGGDPGVLGQPFPMAGMTATIVGVMPAGFGYPAEGVGYWIGHDMTDLRADVGLYQNARFFSAIARMRAGIAVDSAVEALHQHSLRLADAQGAALRDWQLRATTLLDDTVGTVRPVLLALLLIAALALLVACANAVNLVVLRGVARMQELAVQQALGASGGRLARALFLETIVLGVIATVLGILLAAVALRYFVGIGDSGVPRSGNVGLSLPVLVAAAAFGLLASLVAASVPAWRLRRVDAAGALRSGDTRVIGIGGLGRALPVLACAVSVGGLAAALLLAGSLWKLERVAIGYETAPVLGLQLFRDPDPSPGGYASELIRTLRAVPGVAEAATMSSMPLSPIGAIPVDVTVPGRELREPLMPNVRTVSGPAHDVLGLTLLRGRWLGDGDHAGSEPVAVVNQSFAERVFPAQDAIGQTISVPPFGTSGARRSFRIVGIMADARMKSVLKPAEPELWLPDAQYWVSSITALMRAHSDPASLLQPAQRAVWALHPDQGIHLSPLLAALRDRQLRTPRFFARNAGAFAFLALLLSAIGVHSVVAFQMTRRRREFALRLALGSDSRQLAGRVLRSGYGLGLPAALIGAMLGLAFAQVLQSAVVGMDGAGVWATVVAALLLLVIVGLSCLRSVFAAVRTEPMLALRSD